jgi:hypothetical protein
VTRSYVGFHQHVRAAGGRVEFPISIQNSDEKQFSRRPAEAWIEITPIGAATEKFSRLLFYDLQFETGRPVPVLVCPATDWPAAAERAQIDLFFKSDQTPTQPQLRRPVVEAERAPPESQLQVTLADGGKVQFAVSIDAVGAPTGSQITVKETCARESDLYQAKVEIESVGASVADFIERAYFHSPEQQEVLHKFIYLGKTPAEVRNYWVRVTAREDLEKGAYKLDEPIEVMVGRQ